MNLRNRAKQSGFTLVEIAIVLVIIGLLLGGVLKGQEMIDTSKMKGLSNDMKAVQTAYQSYLDRYKAVPGDDLTATSRFAIGAFTTNNGDGNGVINGNYQDFSLTAVTSDAMRFWLHTRASGFIGGTFSGSATTGVAPSPRHGFNNGLIGIEQRGAMALTGVMTCAGGVPLKFANFLDVEFDDGDNKTGTVRSINANLNAGAAVTVPGALNPNTDLLPHYTACMKF